MLSARISKLATTDSVSKLWKTQLIDENSSFILLASSDTSVSVTIQGPLIIRAFHLNDFPLKVYVRKQDVAVKYWNDTERQWKKFQVTLKYMTDVPQLTRKLMELGITTVDKDLSTQASQASMQDSQKYSESQNFLEAQSMISPTEMNLFQNSVNATLKPSKLLSDYELKQELLKYLDNPEFYKLVERISSIL